MARLWLAMEPIQLAALASSGNSAASPRARADRKRCARANGDAVRRCLDEAQIGNAPQADELARARAGRRRAPPSVRAAGDRRPLRRARRQAAPAPPAGCRARSVHAPPHYRAWSASSGCELGGLRGRGKHRFEDAHEACAAAEIAGQAFANFGHAWDADCSRAIAPRPSACPACRCRTARRRIARNACCSGCSLPFVPALRRSESIAPSACSTGTRQLFTSSPFMRTEQEPHSPSPQPSLVPVRCRSSRSTSSRRFMGGACTVRCSPFTVKSNRGPVMRSYGCRLLRNRWRAASSANRSSGSSGIEWKLTPVASLIAFRIAGAGPSCGNSPMPLAP